jgi:arylsulfatase A-like enzyme
MRMAVYAAQVDRMDQDVGRVVGRPRDHGLLDDTVILVCSDNGGSSEFLQDEAEVEGADRYRGSTTDGRPVRIGNIPDLAPGGPADLAGIWDGVAQWHARNARSVRAATAR